MSLPQAIPQITAAPAFQLPVPIPQTPIPQTPIPQTPIPQTPIPQTPIPQTPAPQTPIPQTPVPQSQVIPPAPRAQRCEYIMVKGINAGKACGKTITAPEGMAEKRCRQHEGKAGGGAPQPLPPIPETPIEPPPSLSSSSPKPLPEKPKTDKPKAVVETKRPTTPPVSDDWMPKDCIIIDLPPINGETPTREAKEGETKGEAALRTEETAYMQNELIKQYYQMYPALLEACPVEEMKNLPIEQWLSNLEEECKVIGATTMIRAGVVDAAAPVISAVSKVIGQHIHSDDWRGVCAGNPVIEHFVKRLYLKYGVWIKDLNEQTEGLISLLPLAIAARQRTMIRESLELKSTK